MQKSSKSLKPSPSIHNIIIEDQQAQINNQIKQFFKSQQFPTFHLSQLLSLPNFSNDQRFYRLVKQLQDWNRRAEAGSIPVDSRAQLYRNKFIYTQLKNLVFQGSKTGDGYETNLNKLYEWWRRNSREQAPMFLTTRKINRQDDEWQVRKTFKTNMPLELQNYERRALFSSQDNLRCFHEPKTIENNDKLVNYLAVKQFNAKQVKLREAREEQEIERGKTLLKTQKARFLEDNCHNIQLYQGHFNQPPSSLLFTRKSHKPASNPPNRIKNSNSFTLLQKEKQQIHKIKKYRFNSALNKKRNLYPEPNTDINKTSKTQVGNKPIDPTSSEPGINPILPRKDSLMKQLNSVPVNEQNVGKDAAEQFDKENRTSDFMDFVQLANWDGQRLMSNPFDKKKPAKKGKKKSS